ncbi:methanogenesis marker 8 protein [Methanobacterium sp.]|uniref:methanogenesis marker 8 protein n=1 Tax=Methanobacterium sp. TaxID=2164 RepID=UPI002AB8E016|nr:methanogenesis marker 8 protein [Methanobacterium sp.]MDY9923723.1 methanogenesis marker 8 protein [Methanobacterium sp.]
MDEHVMEALGKSKVIIKNGKVVEVEEPLIDYCPLFHKYRGIEKLTPQVIKENMEFRINDFGMCTSQRKLKMVDFLSFGISETLGTLMDENIIQCAVIVCEGCGTVIVEDPELVQGIGGRISGIISTTPITEVITVVGLDKVLNPETAKINQVEGVIKAIDEGYTKIGVTVASAGDALKIREIESQNKDVKIYIFTVHTTGLSSEDAETLFEQVDVITACASLQIRKIAEERDVFSVGASIPIYAASKDGEKFLKMRIEKIGGVKEKKDARIPDPLI